MMRLARYAAVRERVVVGMLMEVLPRIVIDKTDERCREDDFRDRTGLTGGRMDIQQTMGLICFGRILVNDVSCVSKNQLMMKAEVGNLHEEATEQLFFESR